MIIQIFITAILLATLGFFLAHRPTRGVFRLAIVATVLFGIYLAWFPAYATRIAEFFGVGRGADLITYVWILLSIFVFILIYIKFVEQNRLLTLLVRRLALLDANNGGSDPDKND